MILRINDDKTVTLFKNKGRILNKRTIENRLIGNVHKGCDILSCENG